MSEWTPPTHPLRTWRAEVRNDECRSAPVRSSQHLFSSEALSGWRLVLEQQGAAFFRDTCQVAARTELLCDGLPKCLNNALTLDATPNHLSSAGGGED